MAEASFRNESPTEYFRDLVESALQHQHLAAGELTSFYLVNLLAGFVQVDRSPVADDEPLGVRLAKALQAAGVRQRDGLRQVGDHSLFISGFFADSLNRSLVDVDYYIQLGERAYASLARQGDDAFGEVFDELAGQVHRVRGCARRSQRADGAELEFGSVAALRKVDADARAAAAATFWPHAESFRTHL